MNNIRRISGLAFFFGGLAFLKFSQLEPFCGSSCFNILRGFTFMEIDQNTHTHTHTDELLYALRVNKCQYILASYYSHCMIHVRLARKEPVSETIVSLRTVQPVLSQLGM